MKTLTRYALAGLFAALTTVNASSQETNAPAEQRSWWNEGFPRRQPENPAAKQLPLIKVSGNRLVSTNGEPVLFRGVSISDPDKIEAQGHWNKQHFEKVKETGAMVVRIPIHPAAWRERTPAGTFALLDQAVAWCTELDMYVIIDWHSIGNLGMELFQNPMYDTTQKETYEFWRAVARHFKGNNTVAFYELFNEPTVYNGQLGSMTWSEWKAMLERTISLIRSYDSETIPIVAGFDWAYDLTPLRSEPINTEGIAYAVHPYAFKRNKPWEPKWEEDFGFAAERYPIIATEFGFGLREGQTIDEDHYGNAITRYLEGRNISWVAWCFDPEWGPRLLKSWDYDLTPAGQFFKDAMHREPAK